MLPLLKLAAENEQVHRIADLREELARRLNSTPDQPARKLPSSRQSIFDKRVGWPAPTCVKPPSSPVPSGVMSKSISAAKTF